jgi:hypothetical protein
VSHHGLAIDRMFWFWPCAAIPTGGWSACPKARRSAIARSIIYLETERVDARGRQPNW